MKVSFNSKEESKQRQQEEFLALSGIERIYNFLDMMRYINSVPTKEITRGKNENFIIEIVRS